MTHLFHLCILCSNLGSPATDLKASPGGMDAVLPGAFSSSELSSCIKSCIGADGGKYHDAQLHKYTPTYPDHLNL